VTFDADHTPILYQQTPDGSFVKIIDKEGSIIDTYPMLIHNKLSDKFTPIEGIHTTNSHVLGHFNSTIYKPNEEMKQGFFFLDRVGNGDDY
jgi:hypothetical protein